MDEKLPGARGLIEQYFYDHPKRAEYLRPMVEGITSMFGVPTQAERTEAVKRQIGDQNAAQGLHGIPMDLVEPSQHETVVPKGQTPYNRKADDLLDAHEKGRAGALMDALGPKLAAVHMKLGIDDEDAETILHNFADTTEGRKITEALLKGKGSPDAARRAYLKFAMDWTNEADIDGDKQPTKDIEIDDPVVIDAAQTPPAEVARVLSGGGRKPVVINNASDYGFRSNRAVVMERKAKGKVSPESVVDSVDTPVVTPDEFIDVIKMIRGR